MLRSHRLHAVKSGVPFILRADMKTDVMARIDREYPHQVLLPIKLDADTEEDLIWWLDRRIGRWDMYVDLNRRFIRYCFYEEKDANAFRLRFVAGTIKAAC